MIRLLSVFLAIAFLASPLAADEAQKSANLADVAKMIREGKIDVGNQYDTSIRGRFHKIHVEALGLEECSTCHFGKAYQPDFMWVRKEEAPATKAGRVDDAGSCLSCHRTGGVATTWYGERPGKSDR